MQESLSTGIEALDGLLFGDALQRDTNGFAPGEIVVIRGEPGSGKTTLALQIASNVLSRHPLAAVQFITMEESRSGLERKQQTYHFCENARIQWLERSDVDKWLHKVANPDASPEARAATRLAAEGTTQALAGLLETLGIHVDTARVRPGVDNVLGKVVKLSQQALRHFATSAAGSHEGPTVVVIDSLNAFMNLLTQVFPHEKPRLLFNTFCQKLRTGVGDGTSAPVIILTGEHHFNDSDLPRHLPESFFCDTEIVLRTEAVRAPRQEVASDKFTLGYAVGALLEQDAKSTESRSFCRVPKSRHSPNQMRRCAYDIERGCGIRFFETYPGDGKLLLFAENERQREAWQSFLYRDIPDAYPALRCEMFTMSVLQSVYESTRRLQNLPLRTDMALCTLDSYWVAGYRDYRLKKLVNERLQLLIEDRREPFSKESRVCKHTLMERIFPQGAGEDLAADARVGATRLERSPASRRACVVYPRLANDLLHYTLQRLELGLYQETRRSVVERMGKAGRRARRLADLIETRTATLATLERELAERYDEPAKFLFGLSVVEVARRVSKGLSLKDTFLRPLPRSRISLMGQYDSDLLPSLSREDMHQFHAGEDYWLSVPYDANIGVFVVRKDLLNKLVQNPTISEFEFSKIYERLKQRELSALQRLRSKASQHELDRLLARCQDLPRLFAQIDAAIREVEDQLTRAGEVWQALQGDLPARLTWDQVLVLSALGGHSFGVETRVFDTMIAFFLELIWNCGGKLNVDARYVIEDKPAQIVPLVRALHYFSAIFELTATPAMQSVDPTSRVNPGEPYGGWLFGRLWYSTLVDAVTATRIGGDPATNRAPEFVWAVENPGTPSERRPDLEILPMPTGLGLPSPHWTCWGDWNFALLAGSENVALACDLVSNLMGALKVTERGLRGAGLPTVTWFYERYANERCVPQHARADIGLPKMTFGELRHAYLEPGLAQAEQHSSAGGGIFRQCIFDYRHCARELYAVLLEVKNLASPDLGEASLTRIVEGAMDIIVRIEQFRNRYMFIGDSFRHDVLKTAERAGDRRKLVRLQLDSECQLVVAAKVVPARLRDLTAAGCRVQAPVAPGSEPPTAVLFPNGQRCFVDVMARNEGGDLGLKFKTQIESNAFLKVVNALC